MKSLQDYINESRNDGKYYIEGTNSDGFRSKYTKSGTTGEEAFTYADKDDFGGATYYASEASAKKALARIAKKFPDMKDLKVCKAS